MRRKGCCSLVSHGEYADGTDRQTVGHQTITLCFLRDVASIIINLCNIKPNKHWCVEIFLSQHITSNVNITVSHMEPNTSAAVIPSSFPMLQ